MSTPGERARINDTATQLALLKLAESRQRLAEWTSEMSQRVAARKTSGLGALGLGALGLGGLGLGSLGLGSFKPRSRTLQMLMSMGLSRLPWMRLAMTAFTLFRTFRRR
jgi:hypothetical protein